MGGNEDTSDTGTTDTGTTDTGSTTTAESGGEGATTTGGTVTAGPAEEVIHQDRGGKQTDVTNRPNAAFPTGSTVPQQSSMSGGASSGESAERPRRVIRKVDAGDRRRLRKKRR